MRDLGPIMDEIGPAVGDFVNEKLSEGRPNLRAHELFAIIAGAFAAIQEEAIIEPAPEGLRIELDLLSTAALHYFRGRTATANTLLEELNRQMEKRQKANQAKLDELPSVLELLDQLFQESEGDKDAPA